MGDPRTLMESMPFTGCMVTAINYLVLPWLLVEFCLAIVTCSSFVKQPQKISHGYFTHILLVWYNQCCSSVQYSTKYASNKWCDTTCTITDNNHEGQRWNVNQTYYDVIAPDRRDLDETRDGGFCWSAVAFVDCASLSLCPCIRKA